MRQVSKNFYTCDNYDEFHRWSSYWFQIRSILETDASSVLELGCGTGVTSMYLRENTDIKVETFDFDESLNPDTVGDVRKIDEYYSSKSFDCVTAFQVLEHIPYRDFKKVLSKISNISRDNVILSLPYWGYFFQIKARIFKLKWVYRVAKKFTLPKEWLFNGQHYWEIGTKRYPLSRIKKDISKNLQINDDYFCPEYPYHYFFECSNLRDEK